MLALPANLTAEAFLTRYWQKQPLFMPGALQRVRPAITRNELAWLATLEDVESRLVFVERGAKRSRYRAESGPFDPEYLQNLPKQDWTLLVHDIEKHLPAMRSLFKYVPFIPDWRIDDLMVSFAAPGGGVGPHKDHYDVFLCQGIGVRSWRYTNDDVTKDPDASDELALLSEFAGDSDVDTVEGDILYLPPGTPHWGTAKRACMTYSIGMRAPQASDISLTVGGSAAGGSDFYQDTDLIIDEAVPGYISRRSTRRAAMLLGLTDNRRAEVGEALGRFATQNKDWLKPDAASVDEVDLALAILQKGGRLRLHGMSQVAFDGDKLYVNGSSMPLASNVRPLIREMCTKRVLSHPISEGGNRTDTVRWMLQHGAFEIPENC